MYRYFAVCRGEIRNGDVHLGPKFPPTEGPFTVISIKIYQLIKTNDHISAFTRCSPLKFALYLICIFTNINENTERNWKNLSLLELHI